jgi:hypothetical protein
MANQDHSTFLLHSITTADGANEWNEWNEWRNAHVGIFPDLSGVDLSGADLREADLTGVDFTSISGPPIWPEIEAAPHLALREEASAPITAPEHLAALAWRWPGILAQEELAANPNTPAPSLSEVASRASRAFFANPAVERLFVESPGRLSRGAAQRILDALRARPRRTPQSRSRSSTSLSSRRRLADQGRGSGGSCFRR